MNSEQLLDALNEVDESFILEAAPKPEKQKPTTSPAWRKWLAAAVCLCLAVAAAVLFREGGVSVEADPPPIAAMDDEGPAVDEKDLPLIGISPLMVNAGFEGRMCYSPEELTGGNPWHEAWGVDTLPVYKSGYYDASGAGVPRGLNEDQLRADLEEAASDLGLIILDTQVIADGLRFDGETWVEDSETPTRIEAVTDRGTIGVSASGSVVYRPPAEQRLPDGLSLDPGDPVKMKEAAEYLLTVYGGFLGFAEPAITVSGDYDIYGEYWGWCGAYDAAGGERQDFLNYSFASAGFIADGQGGLGSVSRSCLLESADKMGDYPLIPPDEARELLAAGNYQSSVPQSFPGTEYIAYTELVYRTGPSEEYLLPYYRFYVFLPEMEAQMERLREGMHLYGAFYVPAIPSQYIVDMPLYDGRFG